MNNELLKFKINVYIEMTDTLTVEDFDLGEFEEGTTITGMFEEILTWIDLYTAGELIVGNTQQRK